MADIRFREDFRLLLEGVQKNKELCNEEGLKGNICVPDEVYADVLEIVDGLSQAVSNEMNVAFAYLDYVLYARIYDGEKYVFPLPFMLSEDSDAEASLINLSIYARRELIPLIISDVPRDELEFLCSVFAHVDAYTYEDDDDSFFVKVNSECDMLDAVPAFELDGIRLDELSDNDKDAYAELCRDRDLNKFWGYDVDCDNPDGNADYYLNIARREFFDGVAITLAVREGERFVGEGTIYDFDYIGGASVAVRVLPGEHSRGLGSRAFRALVELSRQIGLSHLRSEIFEDNVRSIKMTSKFMNVEKCENGKVYFTLSL